MFKKFAKFVTFVFISLFYSVRISGAGNIPEKGAFILCSNHQAELDMFIIGHKIKRWIYWMAKEELYKNFILAYVLKLLGAFPIKRGKIDKKSISTAYRLLDQGHAIGIFPQGTRIKKEDIKKASIKPGAAMIAMKKKVPVLPVAIDGSYKLFGRISLIFGQPFIIEGNSGDRLLTKQQGSVIMDKIYTLMEEC